MLLKKAKTTCNYQCYSNFENFSSCIFILYYKVLCNIIIYHMHQYIYIYNCVCVSMISLRFVKVC